MASSSNDRQIRSFSLPSKSNLVNKSIEEELERLRIKEASSTSASETISIGLSGLADLYLCINQVLSLPLTQQALSLQKHEKCVGELLKVCSYLQNLCSGTKEMLKHQKKLTEDVLSALSVSTETYYESKMATYISSRKEVIKKAKGLIQSLKLVIDDDSFGSSRLSENEHHRLSSVTKALTCVTIISASVYESVLFFMSSPVSKPTFGSILVSKFIQKSSHAKTGNELIDVDISLQSLRSRINTDKLQIVRQRLKDLAATIQGIENSLDKSYMQMTETKTYLMNIVSF